MLKYGMLLPVHTQRRHHVIVSLRLVHNKLQSNALLYRIELDSILATQCVYIIIHKLLQATHQAVPRCIALQHILIQA